MTENPDTDYPINAAHQISDQLDFWFLWNHNLDLTLPSISEHNPTFRDFGLFFQGSLMCITSEG